jgi:hypothetical protein
MNLENSRRAGIRAFEFLLLSWIAGSAFFYFLRFSITFYHANADAIRTAVRQLGL